MNHYDYPFGKMRENALPRFPAAAHRRSSRKLRRRLQAVGRRLAELAARLRGAGFLPPPWSSPIQLESQLQSAVQALRDEPALWLSAGAVTLLPAGEHQVVGCDAGMVWITQGDGRDLVLSAGQQIELHPEEQIVITAMFAPALVRCARRKPFPGICVGKGSAAQATPCCAAAE